MNNLLVSVESFDNFGLKTTFINVFEDFLKVKQIFQTVLNTGLVRNKKIAVWIFNDLSSGVIKKKRLIKR